MLPSERVSSSLTSRSLSLSLSGQILKDQRIFSGDKCVASVREATRVTFLVSTYGDAHGDSQNMSKIMPRIQN